MSKIGRKLLRLISAVIVIGLIIGSIVQPWYETKYSASILSLTSTLDVQYSLTQQSVTFTTTAGSTQVVDTTWTESWTNSTAYPNLKNVYVTSSGFVFVGLISYVVSAAILLLDIVPFCSKKLHHFVRLLALLAALIGTITLAIGAVLLFRQPKALQKDYNSYHAAMACSDSCTSFAGSGNSDGVTSKWGPVDGWYLCWAAFAVGIITVILIGRDRHFRKHGYRKI